MEQTGKVTKRELKQIIPLQQEIAQLREEVRKEFVQDGVQASQQEYPFLKHTVRIEGLTEEGRHALRRLQRCTGEYRRLMRFVYDIQDSLVRQTVFYYYVQGIRPWDAVAAKMGGANTGTGLKVMVHRYLRHLENL